MTLKLPALAPFRARLLQDMSGYSRKRFLNALGLLCIVGLLVWPRLWAVDSLFRRQLEQVNTVSALKATSRLPAPVVALLTLSLLAWFLQMPVETIGTRFGGIAQNVPVFAVPDFSWDTAKLLVTPTLAIAA